MNRGQYNNNLYFNCMVWADFLMVYFVCQVTCTRIWPPSTSARAESRAGTAPSHRSPSWLCPTTISLTPSLTWRVTSLRDRYVLHILMQQLGDSSLKNKCISQITCKFQLYLAVKVVVVVPLGVSSGVVGSKGCFPIPRFECVSRILISFLLVCALFVAMCMYCLL